MAALENIIDFISEELRLGSYEDASLNGLQVEGAAEVQKIAVAVDAGQSVISKAAACGAQLLLVHHGLFWGKAFPLVGAKKRTIEFLFRSELSLAAVHLPLDAHETYGNNALLSRLLELEDLTPCALWHGKPIGWTGVNRKLNRKEIADRLRSLKGGPPSIVELPFGPEKPRRVCVVSGSAADQLLNFKQDDFDTLVSGEAKQFAYHFCQDNGLNAIFAGHYATETVGVQALGEALAKRFDIGYEFIDEPTGI